MKCNATEIKLELQNEVSSYSGRGRYHVNVLGISMNGKRLPIEQEVLRLKNVIDLGAGATSSGCI